MKLFSASWGRTFACVGALSAMGVGILGWQPPPWDEVRVFRTEFHRARIPHEAGMRVRDAVARSRAILGISPNETVVLYRWRSWSPERIPDSAVLAMQGALGYCGMHHWSSALWQWWDGFVPRQSAWREVARDASAHDHLLGAGEMIVLRSAR
jgi:hypothetical protein